MVKIPARFLWATELLDVKSTDNILEIGCGAGLLAEQIANKLTKGQLLAIDKSATLLNKAEQRNRKFIDNGLVRFLASDFLQSELPDSYFDSIVAFNVPFFWKSPVRELLYIRQSLKPQGKLYIFYQAPFEINFMAAEPLKQELIKNEFSLVSMQLKKLLPTSAFCIIAKPN